MPNKDDKSNGTKVPKALTEPVEKGMEYLDKKGSPFYERDQIIFYSPKSINKALQIAVKSAREERNAEVKRIIEELRFKRFDLDGDINSKELLKRLKLK